MRILGPIALALLAGCSTAPPPAPLDANAFAVDAKGATAVIDQTLTLDGLGRPLGFVTSVERCGDLLLFADVNGAVRRMNLANGATLPSIAPDTANMAMAADCGARRVYLFGPSGAGRQRGRLQVATFDFDTGAAARVYPFSMMFLPDWNAAVVGGALIIGGTWMPTPAEGQYAHPPATSFFSDKKLGFRLALDSGEGRPFLAPFDVACRANCPFSTLAPVEGVGGLVWVATQASSKEVAFYDAGGAVKRRFDVTSPLFTDDGSVMRTLGGEPNVRWSARNSLIKQAFQFGAVLATVHHRTILPKDYVFGQSTEFDYWMNLHALDGRRLVSDIKLPGMPIGRDETHLYVTDYGPDGRHSAPDQLKILRVPVRAGTESFRP